MFIFGHLGIGSKLVSPWTAGLKRRDVLIGTLLPDLIDKPLYYSLWLATGKRGAELGLVSGTRTFGHTAILLLLLVVGSIFRKSKLLAALALGTATHLFLDNLADHFLPPGRDPSALQAMTWPLLSWNFPAIPVNAEGFIASLTPFVLGGEAIGLALLAWDYWKLAHEREILETTQERRRFFRKIKKARRRSRSHPS